MWLATYCRSEVEEKMASHSSDASVHNSTATANKENRTYFGNVSKHTSYKLLDPTGIAMDERARAMRKGTPAK